MVKLDMIGIPLKKASEVDVLKPLKNLLTSRYQSSDQESYITAINELSKMRNSSVCKTLDFHEKSLETLYKYYDQLVHLEAKIPASELQIPFKWRDAFDKGSIFSGRASLTLSSLAYEKVCVLFNIAAMQSQVAANQSSESDEAMKLSAKLFQSAAGIFTYLKTIVHSSLQQEPTLDLQPDTLAALSALMVAQAQEVIAIKAGHDRMKDVIVAKLFSQCEDHYSETSKLMQKELLKSLWLPKVTSKQIGFLALTMYHQSRVCNAEKAVGEEIARLKYALELFKTAQGKSADGSMFSQDIGRCQRAHDEAVKDNDFIYHEKVPDAKSLPPIGKANVAKPSAMPDDFSSNFSDLFETLVPISVQQALSQYDVRKTEIVNVEIGKLRESTQLLNSILASLNLPAAIEDTTGDKVPQSLKDKAQAVSDKGGINTLDQLLKELPDLLKRNRELLDESIRQLQEEKESDDQLRAQFQERWTRTASEKLTSTFQTNVDKYRILIETAVQADTTIRNNYETHKRGFCTLSQGSSSLVATIPSVTSSNINVSSVSVLRLKKLMEDVETIKAERDAIESEIKGGEVDMRSVFLAALAHDGAIDEPALSIESLGRTFCSLQKQVQESVSRQELLVSDIQTAHSEFSGGSGSESDREVVLKSLAAAHDSFFELLGNLLEGTKFYNELTQLLVNIQCKISDFCFARRTEKEELMKDLTRGLANQNVGAAPAQPAHHQQEKVVPARPPPPVHNPYHGAPQQPIGQAPAIAHAGAPQGYPGGIAPPTGPGPAAPPAYASGAPGTLPYPINPQGMPAPQGGYPYQPYTPMPHGFNPYYAPQQEPQPPYAPYPQQQQQPYGGFPAGYPQQPPAPNPQWPPRT